MWFDMQNDEFFVIYLVDLFTNQFPFEMSYLCSTFLYELAENIVTSSLTDGFHHKDSVDIPLSLDQVLHQVKQKIILDTIPVELIRDVSLGDSYMNIKKALCFLLYSRCRPCVSIDETVNSRSESTQIDLRLVVPSSTSLLHLDTIKPVSEITFLHSSIFSLAPPNLQPPLFSMTQPYESSYQLTCEPDRLLHIIYEVVKDWICVCWCDGRGEMIELTAFRFSASSDSALDSRRVSFCKIWARTLELIGVYGFGWRLVFAKRGELSAYEIQGKDVFGVELSPRSPISD